MLFFRLFIGGGVVCVVNICSLVFELSLCIYFLINKKCNYNVIKITLYFYDLCFLCPS